MEYALTKFRIKPGKKSKMVTFLKQIEHEPERMYSLLGACRIHLDVSFLDEESGEEILYIFKKLDNKSAFISDFTTTDEPYFKHIRDIFEDCCDERREVTPILILDKKAE